MKKFLKRLAGTILVLFLAAWIFWPTNWAVRGPILDLILMRDAPRVADSDAERIFSAPEGHSVGVYAWVPHARVLRFAPDGSLLVTSTREKQIVRLLPDANGDGVPDGQEVLLDGLERPHGLAVHDGWLYVGEESRISRWPFMGGRITGDRETVAGGFPVGGNHRTRTIGIDGDGWLYATTGSTCNVCEETEPYRATMVRMRPDGSDFTVFAEGLRNSVGFDWQPDTGKLFATDNGRDLLGDEIPNCELNEVIEGGHYGWPYAMDNQVPDPDFGTGNEALVAASLPMAHGFGGHRAPLGMRFMIPGMEPAGMEGAALVALHGSWNRSTLAGYKVVSLHWDAAGYITQRDFLTGFEKDGEVIGRPADVEQGPDGAIYVADDYSGTIYRVAMGDTAGSPVQMRQHAMKPLAADWELPENWQEVGAALYEDHVCASCHEIQGGEDAPLVKALDGIGARYGAGGIFQLLETPPGNMPDPELSEREREILASWLARRYP